MRGRRRVVKLTAAFKNTDRVARALRKMKQEAEREALKALKKGATEIRNEAVRLIRNPPKTGIVYGNAAAKHDAAISKIMGTKRNKRLGVIHQASAPGQAPAWDTGHLAGSINVASDASTKTVTIKVLADYGARLEFGTRNIKPRPFLRPAIEAKKHLLPKHIRDSFRVVKPTKG